MIEKFKDFESKSTTFTQLETVGKIRFQNIIIKMYNTVTAISCLLYIFIVSECLPISKVFLRGYCKTICVKGINFEFSVNSSS